MRGNLKKKDVYDFHAQTNGIPRSSYFFLLFDTKMCYYSKAMDCVKSKSLIENMGGSSICFIILI